MIRFSTLLLACCCTMLLAITLPAQSATDTLPVRSYSEPQDFEIGGIEVEGATFSDANAIIGIAGLKVGEKIRIPGGDIPKAVRALWKLRLFTDVQIVEEKTIGEAIFLKILVEERPRLSRYAYKGAKKTDHDDLNDEVGKHLLKGGIVTDNVKVNAREEVRNYYVDKGFLDAKVKVSEYPDTQRINSVRLVFDIDRGDRVKIQDIDFIGNDNITDKKLRKQMENTKEKRKIFASSKYIASDFREDKKAVINYYNNNGFRDARFVGDSIWRDEKGNLRLALHVEEGSRYYFRNITWKGNSIYDDETLASVLGIEKGDVYNNELLQTRLSFSQDGRDVSTLYLDNGYLFFRADPIEVSVVEDSIDLEMRIYEGPQATIDKVTIAGNDRTHEHVIRRELRTRPGQKFSRSDIIRSQREIINLGYFNPETLGINTPVNPQRGTVNIEYQVEEKPSDQLELSAGWGGQRRVIGTLGVSFNNFSVRNIFKKEAWKPLPQGDGQRLSLRAQTNGTFFQSYNASFTEPWLGGKKPMSLTVGGFYNAYSFPRLGTTPESLKIIQGSVTLGTRLKWPDDNFISRTTINIQTLGLQDWRGSSLGAFRTDEGEIVSNGNYNNFSLNQTFARSSVNDPTFPREGSSIELSVQLTPPYSLFNNKDYSDLPAAEKFRYLEYHKWRFKADWYTPLGSSKFVIKAAANIGVLGSYNSELGTPPFERFQLGGDGINNNQFGFQGVDIISLRGYETNDLPANAGNTATPIFDKFTVELRYPLSLNPQSTIYVLAFAQGGNSWRNLRDFNPFDLKRSAGMGLRVFLPMFGVLGFDYGVGFDKVGDDRSLKALGDFNIILGFEPE